MIAPHCSVPKNKLFKICNLYPPFVVSQTGHIGRAINWRASCLDAWHGEPRLIPNGTDL